MHGNKRRSAEARPGDWLCPKCKFMIFASKAKCSKCQTPKPAAAAIPPSRAAMMQATAVASRQYPHGGAAAVSAEDNRSSSSGTTSATQSLGVRERGASSSARESKDIAAGAVASGQDVITNPNAVKKGGGRPGDWTC